MAERTGTQPTMSRRRFGALVLGGAGAIAAGGVTVIQLADSGPGQAVRTFDVHHDPSVYVTMTQGEEFVVEIKEHGTRRVLERHDGVTAYNLLSLNSDYVSISETS